MRVLQIIDAGRDLDSVFAEVQRIADETIAANALLPLQYFQ